MTAAIRLGDLVSWARPADAREAAERFTVAELLLPHHPADTRPTRVLLRATAASMPGWNPNLLPLCTVEIGDIRRAD
jgi:hypothetical protein